MKTKLFALAMIAAFSFIALPAESFEVDAQRRYWSQYDRGWDRGDRRRYRRWRERRNRNRLARYYGYRNYGQYRRERARRWRWINRTYWRNGYPYTRRVRVYYNY